MRLDKFPDEGKFIVAHPSCEASARLHAEGEGLDYLLSDLCTPGMVYLMNPDAVAALFAGAL
jgi:hypothetical protein